MVQFNPIQHGSYADEYNRARQQQQQADAPAREFERYNDQLRMQLAQRAGKNIQAMAALSPTVEKLIGHEVEKHKKRAKIAAAELEYETSLANPYAPEGKDKIEYEKYKEEFEKDRDSYNDLAIDAFDRGAAPEVVEELNSLSGWKAYYYGKQHLKTLSEGIAPYLKIGMMGDSVKSSIDGGKTFFTPSQALTFEEKAQSVQDLWNKFQEDNGLDAYEKHFLMENYFPTAYKAKQQLINTLREEERVRVSAENILNIQSNFAIDKNWNKAYKAIQSNWNPNSGRRYNSVEATKMIDERIKQLARAELITVEDIDKIAQETATHTGKPFGETFPARIKEWKHYIKNAKTEILKDKLEQQELSGLQFQLEITKKTQEKYTKGEAWTNDELKVISKKWTQLTGKEEPKWIKDIYTRQEAEDDDAREQLLKLRQQRGLTEEDLKPYSPKIYQEFIPFVKADESFMNIPKADMDNKLGQIEDAARRAAGLNAVDETSIEFRQMKFNGQKALKARIRHYMSPEGGGLPWAGKDGALNRAKEEILNEFNLDSSTTAGANFLDKQFDLDSTHQIRLDIADGISAIDKDPKILKLPKGGERYIDLARQYRDGKIDEVPAYFDSLSRGKYSTRLDAWDIMDRYLKSIKEPGLDASNEEINKHRQAKQAFGPLSKGTFERPTHAGLAQLVAVVNDFELKLEDENYESLFNLPPYASYEMRLT